MQAERPAKLIDPVCGMTVDVAGAEAAGLLLEYEGRNYAFCRKGCLRAFVESPAEFVAKAEADAAAAEAKVEAAKVEAAKVEAAKAEPAAAKELPTIDIGMRLWYDSCPCCLSETYPEIKAQLDAEHAAAGHAHTDH
jgi:YHS domain-containing protein